MSLSKTIELAAGIATAVGQTVAVVMLGWHAFSGKYLVSSIVAGLFFFVLPGLAVFVGSYVHVIAGKTYGRRILGIGVIIVCVVGLFNLALEILYSYDHSLVAMVVLPPLTALVACLASFISGTNPSNNSQRKLS
jgi:hypothetical protein